MPRLQIKLQRLRVFLLGCSSKRDLEKEISFHVELLIAENIANGMSAEDARAQALRQFGNLEKIKSQCYTVHRGSFSRATLWLMGVASVCGAVLWVNSYSPQASVLGQLLVITILLLRLLMYLRAWPVLVGSSASPSSELTILAATKTSGSNDNGERRHGNHEFSAFARTQMLRVVALCAVIGCSLCALVIVSSAKALSDYRRHAQETNTDARKFVGAWVLTVGDVYDLKDSALPMPFRNLQPGLPRNLPLAEVIIELRNEKITGKRLLYSYAPGTNPQSPITEKGEVQLINIRTEGNVLSGEVVSLEGEQLPGGWEMKLTSPREAEVRVTGTEVPEEQKKVVIKLHRVND